MTATDDVAGQDARVVAACRRGERGAWDELVERFSRYVYAIASGAFRLSEADAEDVFQDVFTRAYTHLDTLRDDSAIRPWIAQLTRRLSIDRLRARARLSDEQPPDEGDFDAELERLEEAVSVRASMASLSENCREILDRFFARDESYRTIGEDLGLAAGTIASRISRCLARLRDVHEGRSEPARPSGV